MVEKSDKVQDNTAHTLAKLVRIIKDWVRENDGPAHKKRHDVKSCLSIVEFLRLTEYPKRQELSNQDYT